MDVLELPRPVINFLRTMSKEMQRYSLCWDISGGTENVTLTLTWKLNDLLIFDTIPTAQPQQNNEIPITNTNTTVNPVTYKNNLQTDNSIEQNIKNIDLKDTNKRKSRNKAKDDCTVSRGKSLENLQNNVKTKPFNLNESLNGITSGLTRPSDLLQCPPPSSAYKQRIKSPNVEFVSDPSNNPWIKRNTDTVTPTCSDSTLQLNCNGSVGSLGLMLNNNNNNQGKVKFDPNLHYI